MILWNIVAPPPVIHNATYTKYTCINIVNIMWGGALYQWGGGVGRDKKTLKSVLNNYDR